jgi:hypothetical protein
MPSRPRVAPPPSLNVMAPVSIPSPSPTKQDRASTSSMLHMLPYLPWLTGTGWNQAVDVAHGNGEMVRCTLRPCQVQAYTLPPAHLSRPPSTLSRAHGHPCLQEHPCRGCLQTVPPIHPVSVQQRVVPTSQSCAGAWQFRQACQPPPPHTDHPESPFLVPTACWPALLCTLGQLPPCSQQHRCPSARSTHTFSAHYPNIPARHGVRGMPPAPVDMSGAPHAMR